MKKSTEKKFQDAGLEVIKLCRAISCTSRELVEGIESVISDLESELEEARSEAQIEDDLKEARS